MPSLRSSSNCRLLTITPAQYADRLWRLECSANLCELFHGGISSTSREPAIISLGAGECVHEISLVKKLLEMGETDFLVEALELSLVWSDRAQANATSGAFRSCLHSRTATSEKQP